VFVCVCVCVCVCVLLSRDTLGGCLAGDPWSALSNLDQHYHALNTKRMPMAFRAAAGAGLQTEWSNEPFQAAAH